MGFHTKVKLVDRVRKVVIDELPTEFEAVQLRWDTWNEICSFMGQSFVVGVYLNDDNTLKPDDATDGKLGLRFKSGKDVKVAKELDWIGKFPKISFPDGSTFPAGYYVLPSEPSKVASMLVATI